MSVIRRLVLDLMKPHELTIVEIADVVADVGPGIHGVNAVLIETDRQVDNVKLTVEGDDIEFNAVEAQLTDLGATVHSIDEIICGEQTVDESKTPQDLR